MDPFRATLLRQGYGVAWTRNFCPSCQAKRAALFAERLEDEILAPVPHRHVVFTIPKALRGLFERERKRVRLQAGGP